VAYISSTLKSMTPLKIYAKYNKGLDGIKLVSVCDIYRQVILTCNYKCKSQPSVKGYIIFSILQGQPVIVNEEGIFYLLIGHHRILVAKLWSVKYVPICFYRHPPSKKLSCTL
jgi:hypothetical protein